MRLLPLFIFPILLLTSCEGDVRFTDSQPENMPALAAVPSSLIGDYVNGDDSLFVRSATMTLVHSSEKTISMTDTAGMGLRKSKAGKLFIPGTGNRYVKTATKDSVTIINRNVDVYRLGQDTVVKSWNDACWLSMKDKNTWKVMQVSLHKKKLVIAVPLLPKDEKRRMQERMDASGRPVDSTGVFSVVTPFRRMSAGDPYFVIHATPAQLKNLDRRGLFRPVTTFDKIR